MKYARRSVSDQDIRRYEMFSQVCCLFTGAPMKKRADMFLYRICSSLVDLEITSSSRNLMGRFLPGYKPLVMPGSLKTMPTTTSMLESDFVLAVHDAFHNFHFHVATKE